MEIIKTKPNKFLVILIVFMMLFSNFGYTMAVIASSEEFEVITNGFFKKDEIKFSSYFETENGKKITEITGKVNEKVKLVLEISPNVEGYLKTGTIKAVSGDDDRINFKFSSVTENLLDERVQKQRQELIDTLVEENKEGEKEDSSTPLENVLVEEPKENTTTENTTSLQDALTSETTTPVAGTRNPLQTSNPLTDVLEENKTTNPIATNTSTNTVTNTTENKVENTAVSENVVEDNEIKEQPEEPVKEEQVPEELFEDPEVLEEDKLIDEDKMIQEMTKRAILEEEMRNAILDIKLAGDDEISLSNIIKNTKIEVELEFAPGEKFNVQDLSKIIKLQLSGTFINTDLENVKVGKEEEIRVGWEYTKDIELKSEFTKFSPFQLEDVSGTIVENKITVSREIEDEKYLPVKSTRLEIVVPKINDKKPITVDVISSKLLMTRGEEAGTVTFTQDNWRYDETTGTINILVENDNYVYSKGIDEYVILYRFADYVDSENSNLLSNVKATVVEYSGLNNNTLIKEINDSQNIKVDVGELITYSVSATDEKINKGKIYANYNSADTVYETLFSNQVTLNILTSDVLQQLKIDCTKDVYKDANNVDLEADGIEYKQIIFNFAEVKEMLANGGEIVITNANNETLYILNKDVITKEEDATVNLNGANGIYVYVNNAAKNGTITFELVKSIRKCSYPRTVFKTIKKIESRISAEVKYLNIEERIALQTIAVSKEFEESQTKATLSVSRENFSTIRTNDNVELKIELNNDKTTSDLYINPSFEIVFPKYIKAVSIESINLVNECDLRVADFQTYVENDIVKLKIDLAGIQTRFSDNSNTNGTNIIVNTTIEVDDYTPSKEDQIKLYYFNEGVATYQTQTKWSISKEMPAGILKTTNGFDADVIKYQAPNGLVAINGIVNYDGNLGEVRSVKQGAVSKQIPVNSPSRVATMELLALNNTENTCADIVLVGRIPFKGVKGVINNEELGVTTACNMVDFIKEDVQNTNMAKIYYSSNPNATKSLEDGGNGWKSNITDLSQVKSYMIVVTGDVAAGTVLRYTYDFQIQENLPYEAKIAGSLGMFYNNKTEEAVIYETSSADEVALVTESGPRIEAKLTSDIGDGTEIGEARYITYNLDVCNTGSVEAENVIVSFPCPSKCVFCEYTPGNGYGNNQYIIDTDATRTFNVKSLKPGDIFTKKFVVKTGNVLSEGSPEVYFTSKVTVIASNLGIAVNSNEIKNRLTNSYFDIVVNTSEASPIAVGSTITYMGSVQNISEKDLRNVKAVWTLPSTVTFLNPQEEKMNEGWIYNEETRTATKTIDSINSYNSGNCYIKVKVNKSNSENLINNLTVITEDGRTEKSSDISILYAGAGLELRQSSNIVSGVVLERENVEFNIEIKNKGNIEAKKFTIYDQISPNLTKAKAEISETGVIVPIKDGKIEYTISSLKAEGAITLKITGQAADLDGADKAIVNRAEATYNENDTAESNEMKISIQENSQKEEIPASNNQYKNQPSSSNNGSGTTNNSSNNNKKNNNNTSTRTYNIDGSVWVDANRNGRKDEEEKGLSSVVVQLYKSDNMITSTTTNTKGAYNLKNIPVGDYYIVFQYDSSKYIATSYQNSNVEQELNSKAVENSTGTATTGTIHIENANISNINLGLQNKEKFDLKIEKVITKAKVIIDKDIEEYNFDEEILAKIEIKASKLKKSTVDLEYKIKVSNVGDTSGKAITITDIVPEDMTFDGSKNEGWTMGNDGVLYNNTLKDINLAPGEKRELKLILSRKMTEENTGVISNKVQLLSTESSNELIDIIDNNIATQEMMILIKTGLDGQYILIIAILLAVATIVYSNREMVTNLINGKNNYYKNKEKYIKINIKRKYK